VRVWSLYVPNGRKPDDPHYAYKLAWLAALRSAASAWIGSPSVLVGDWNICPTDDDVFDIKQFAKSTHVTAPERAAFRAFAEDGWREVTRDHAPGYTYWDYYRQRFERDRGLKIDFAYASPSLADRVTGAFVDRDERDPARGAGSPSDHAPVVVDLSD
jgi:exodeoxyribonuclease-3